MNRSVITWMIAAGVLASGTCVAPATAFADPVDVGSVGGADNPRPVRAEGRQASEVRDAGRDGNRQCELVRVCRPGPPPRERERGNTVLGGMRPTVAPLTQRPPVAAAEPVALLEPPDEIPLGPFDGAPLPGTPAESPAVAPAESPAVAPVVAPVVAPMPVGPAVLPRPAPAPVAVAPSPLAPNSFLRSTPAPPAAPRRAPPESPATLRLGYPDELRNADIGRVVSLALPGLAAMAGMTVLGGVFGYRQAKAGYLMRAAGAGRFLQ